MKRTAWLTSLLILGLLCSQLLPTYFGQMPELFAFIVRFLTMSLLAFIMIQVGREFDVDLKNARQYLVDYGVAASAAALPWLFVSIYFFLFLMPEAPTEHPHWIVALLVGRFAAPTSAGVLFSMLAAAGLAETWVYKKTRVLAIFDDLDTVLLMLPLQALLVGFAWQLGGIVVAMAAMLYLGLRHYRKVDIPQTWRWVLGYSFLIVALSEGVYALTKDSQSSVGLHIEVLLPAFLLGCALKVSPHSSSEVTIPGEDKPGMNAEELAGLIISGLFMFLVGFSMAPVFAQGARVENSMSPLRLGLHVLAVTLLSNLGKMFACICYRKEANLRERLALSVALFPRGEVGAGVLSIALGYGISGPLVTVGFMSLALNLVLTGAFIYVVKKLLR